MLVLPDVSDLREYCYQGGAHVLPPLLGAGRSLRFYLSVLLAIVFTEKTQLLSCIS
jgi:hypothetical protein